jgi:predicted alpha/beta hydrolase family esterase
MARLDEVLLDDDRPALLAAHSLAATCGGLGRPLAHRRVCGALSRRPTWISRGPAATAGWRPVVRTVLPFPGTIVYSEDDPFGSPAATRTLAQDWGVATTFSLGPRGHVNAASGLGAWPEGRQLLEALCHESHPRSQPIA